MSDEPERVSDELESMRGMADCMHMVHQELIEAGIIGAKVAPMFIAHAVQAHVFNVLAGEKRKTQAAEAKARHWKTNHDAQVERARILQERTDMPLERVSAYRVMGAALEDFKRFQACRHAARDMPEDGGEEAFIEAVDEYRLTNGV